MVTIDLPPLRERREDIPLLVEHFLATRPVGPVRSRVDPAALKALCAYSWPGNVRELANVLERAQILAEDNLITLDDLPENLVGFHAETADEVVTTQDLHQNQRRHILAVLREHHGNKVHAARALGISRRALYRLLVKYGIHDEKSARPREPHDQPAGGGAVSS